MVKIQINEKKYKVHTLWDEVDYEKLINANDFRDELEVLTDIPRETLHLASELQLFPIYTLVSFIDDDDLYPEFEAVNIEHESYEKLEYAKKLMQTGKNYQKVLRAAMVYYPDEKSTVRLLGLGVNIVNQISLFLENYKEMVSSEPDADEVWAGVERLSDFGAWGTAYVLADKNVLNLKAVMEQPALRIYEALRYNFRESQYMKKLYEIKNRTK